MVAMNWLKFEVLLLFLAAAAATAAVIIEFECEPRQSNPVSELLTMLMPCLKGRD